METKQQTVSSYVRYKKVPKQQNDLLVAGVLGVSLLLVVLVVFWQVSLTLIGTGLVTYKVHKFHEQRAYLRANGLLVNHIDGKREFV